MSNETQHESALTLRQVIDALEVIAPKHLAADWDNVGLLAGDADASCRHALLTIDMTPAVLDEARSINAELIVAYHPPIFRPIHSLRAQSTGTDALVFRAVANGQAIYSMHTALDAAIGGTNDVLAELCGLSDVQPFEDAPAPGSQSKVVVFVPTGDLARVADALFAAGAGRIGQYTECSFSGPGTGTFFGSDATSPTIGQPGRRESVDEHRLEVICPNENLSAVVQAVRQAHSYEEPALDIYPLTSPPTPGVGMGRVGRLSPGTTLGSLVRDLTAKLQLAGVEVIGDETVPLSTAAVCAGSAGRLPLESKRSREADVIVTGELSHHDRLLFARGGRSVILLGHCNSERPVLSRVKQRLATLLPDLTVNVATTDSPPARFV